MEQVALAATAAVNIKNLILAVKRDMGIQRKG